MGMIIVLSLILYLLFGRKLRWTLLPMGCCLISVIIMTGLLGLFGWDVTIISSSFISVQLIITLAMVIHLIIRYEELSLAHPSASQLKLIRNTIYLKFKPCLYASLTTMIGFSSLLFCNIQSVMMFAKIMIMGITVSFLVTFLFFPTGNLRRKKIP